MLNSKAILFAIASVAHQQPCYRFVVNHAHFYYHSAESGHCSWDEALMLYVLHMQQSNEDLQQKIFDIFRYSSVPTNPAAYDESLIANLPESLKMPE